MATQKTQTNTAPLLIPCSYLTTESNKTGSWRFLRPQYEEKTAPCSAACPAGVDIPRVEMLTAQGLFKEAWETILAENPFPGICGRVCYHPCEQYCNRKEFDEPVAIHTLERFLADTASRYELKPTLEKLPAKRQKLAIIGSGPSGLAAAYFLARLGYQADIFEALTEPGGVLRWGIPVYRLPVDILEKEIVQIQELGVRIRCGKFVSQQFIEELKDTYDGIFLGCGHAQSLPLKIPGDDLHGVEDGLQFLGKIRRGQVPQLHGTAAVIGGGNTAIDTARSAARLGVKVLLIYRRRRQDMPAFDEEVEMAQEEGVEIWELQTPVKIEPKDGDLLVTLQRMRTIEEDSQGRARIQPESNKRQEIRVQHLFKAIGASAAERWYDPPKKGRGVLRLSNCVLVPQSQSAALVYGGDLVANIKSVVHAVASGKQAAVAFDTLFKDGVASIESTLQAEFVGEGPAISMEIHMGGPRSQRNHRTVHYEDLNSDYFRFSPRITEPRLLREERLQSFGEINLKIGASLAIREAERCFNCGICNQCDNCRLFCPDIAVMRDDNPKGRHINYDYCKGCGLCVVECPRNAMTLGEERLCNKS
ncbi:MAG: FAD-dependent oxidoreductase [Deltaproteobacteria bacterium]|nr:MAG: FAD-dependent oxidoreductase [Deltaproteobacteria bacterium]